jgi:DNA-binding NtrC family response regulator
VAPRDGKGESGEEVLVVDADKNVLRVLEKVLRDAGLTVTALSDPVRARDQVEKRFIPVVLCDLDTPTQGAGIELVKFAHDKSPLTAVILMTARKNFDTVAAAFRSGARDVVPKTQEALPYLRERVQVAAADIRAAQTRDQLMADLGEMHEEFLKRMMDISRQVTDLEEKILSREGNAPSAVAALAMIDVLLVDDEQALNAVLTQQLPVDKGWRLRHAQSGGEALDAASQAPPQILVVSETLPDLPSTMVIKTIKADAPDAVALVFTSPSDSEPGEVRMVDSSRLLTLIASFSSPEQLVGQLEDVREALRKKAKERRYLQVFRKQHFDFLKKYGALRQRLASAKKL